MHNLLIRLIVYLLSQILNCYDFVIVLLLYSFHVNDSITWRSEGEGGEETSGKGLYIPHIVELFKTQNAMAPTCI